MKYIQNNDAISQIIGEIFLLAIAVTAVSVIAMQVLSTPGPPETTEVTIIGKIDGEHPVFEIQRGESLGPDSTIKIIINNNTDDINAAPQPLSNYIGSFEPWNIGKQIIDQRYVWDPDPLKSLQVEATIVDTKTNAIVFWGIIPGLTTGHLGGLWHFDEPTSWVGGNWQEVKDSSGNKNNGSANNSATLIMGTEPSENNIYKNFGEFKAYRDQHVLVNTSVSLNITKQITIEAWMKPKDIPTIIDQVGLLDQFGYTPYIIHGPGDIYIIVSLDKQNQGKIATVPIDPDGNINQDLYKLVDLPKSKKHNMLRPIITQMNNTMYLVAYNDADFYMHLVTYNISTDGTIDYTGTKNDLIFNSEKCSDRPSNPNRASLQKITNTTCAITYWTPITGGILRTVNVNLTTGKITSNTLANPPYDPASGKPITPCLVHVTGDIYALAYSNGKCILKTYNITSTGGITYTNYFAEFDETGTGGCEPCLIRISEEEGVYAVAYRGQSNHGWVKTIIINPDGSFGDIIDRKEFEIGACFNPCMVQCDMHLCMVAYATANSSDSTLGYCMPLKIEKDGSIDPKINLRQQIKADKKGTCIYPIILQISDRLFACVFEGHVSQPGELMTMFLLAENYPAYRGIFKADSYSIYANTSWVVGSINNKMVNYTHLSPNTWYHFAVTYDGNYITLYIHNVAGERIVPPISRPYSGQISRTPSDLYFGRNYNGYIDEILIYDVALPGGQIREHVLSRLISEDDLFK